MTNCWEEAWRDLFERQARERERSIAQCAARKEAIALARKIAREKGERKLPSEPLDNPRKSVHNQNQKRSAWVV